MARLLTKEERKERNDEVVRLRSGGASYRDIGVAVNLTGEGVRLILRGFGLDGNIRIERTCSICGERFLTNTENRKFHCSRACSVKARNPKMALKVMYRLVERQARNQEIKEEWLSGKYSNHALAHEYGLSELQTYRITHDHKREVTNRICEFCGQEYQAVQVRQKFCSTACYRAMRSEKTKKRNQVLCKQYKTDQYTVTELAAKHELSYSTVRAIVHGSKVAKERSHPQSTRIGVWRHATCFHCGNEYLRAYKKQIYCNIECKLAAQTASRTKRDGLLPKSYRSR